MSRTMLRVFYLTFGKRGTKRILEPNLNIRVMLASYMIDHNPALALGKSHNSPPERELADASKSFIDNFEST
eukprot:431644-Rhodomonas_salina.1